MSYPDLSKEQLAVELLELTQLHVALYDQSPIAIEYYDTAGTLSHVNSSCLRLFGVDSIDAIKGFSIFSDPNISEEHKKKLSRGGTIRYQGPFDFEKVRSLNLYQTKRSGIIWLDVLISPVGNQENVINGYLVQIQDITEQKKYEAAIREAEKRYERMVNNIVDVVYSVDGQTGEYTFMSPVVEKMLGYSWSEIKAMGGRKAFLSAVLPDGKSTEHDDRFTRLHSLMGEDAFTDELWWRCKDGSMKCIADHWNPIYLDGRLVSTDGVLRDITGSKRTGEAFQEALIRAEASDRLKTAFMNNISHEVRTPLNGILGFAEMIDNPDLSHEDLTLYKEILHMSSDRLINTINSYMDISLIVSGNMTISKSQFNLLDILQRSCHHYSDQASAKGVTIRMAKTDQNAELLVFSDGEVIKKVLDHLMENAVKFTEFGTVTIDYTFLPGEIEITVQDTGIGISQDLQDRIFDSFLQADISNTRKHEGSGLGLAIAKG